MFNAIALVQVKAFARQDGFILALVWMASMWLTLQRPESSWGPLLMLCTPFFIGWRLGSFRDNALEGAISFRRGFCYSCYVFFYASILFALGQALYFHFLDNGAFMSIATQSVETMKPIYQQNGLSPDNLDLAVKTLKLMGTTDLVFFFFVYNLLIGLIVSPLISLLCKRKKKMRTL